MTKNTLLNAFLGLFKNKSAISLDEWLRVFTEISSHFEEDDKFHGYVEGLWNLN